MVRFALIRTSYLVYAWMRTVVATESRGCVRLLGLRKDDINALTNASVAGSPDLGIAGVDGMNQEPLDDLEFRQ